MRALIGWIFTAFVSWHGGGGGNFLLVDIVDQASMCELVVMKLPSYINRRLTRLEELDVTSARASD